MAKEKEVDDSQYETRQQMLRNISRRGFGPASPHNLRWM